MISLEALWLSAAPLGMRAGMDTLPTQPYSRIAKRLQHRWQPVLYA